VFITVTKDALIKCSENGRVCYQAGFTKIWSFFAEVVT
jgi:hypothetical protein